MKINFYLVLFLAVFTFSCEDDDALLPPVSPVEASYNNGLLVANEGSFTMGVGTVDFLAEGAMSLERDIFQTVNDGANLGGVLQSISFTAGSAYAIANVSNKITVVDRYTFEQTAVIDTGLSNPRYMAISGDTGYVTNWGDAADPTDDFIAVVDLTSNSITSTIPVAEGPEEVFLKGSSLYVAHQGGFGVNNILSLIDTDTNEVTGTITVGDAPNSLQFGTDGNLWVLSGGASSFSGNETGGQIDVVDITTNAVISSFSFQDTEHPNYLNISESGDVYYYLAGSVYKSTTTNFQIPAVAALAGLNFYNMVLLENNVLAGCNAGDFESNGSIEIYDIATNTLSATYDTGVIPSNIYKN